MDYLPMKGRWATISFIAIVALGATALSLQVDNKLSQPNSTSLEAADRMPSERSSPSAPVLVVNPDGSARKNEVAWTTSDEESEDAATDMNVADPSVDFDATEEEGSTISEWDIREPQNRNLSGGRIE